MAGIARRSSAALLVAALLSAIGFCAARPEGVAKNQAKPKAPAVPIVGDQGPSILVLPQLRAAGAPSWVKPGLRLTYRIQAATIAGTGAEWREDENGAWVSADGRRWSPYEKSSSSGEGFLQVDVVAMGDGACALLASFYLLPRPGDAPRYSFSYPLIGYAANAGGFWVNPGELKKAKTTVSKKLQVLRMPYAHNGVKRDAVWIKAFSDRGYALCVYDAQTGVLLHDALASEGKASPVIGPNEVSNTPTTTLSSGWLVAQRTVNYPWLGGDVSAWSSHPRTLRYTGATQVPAPGGPTVQLGQELIAKPLGSGKGWVRYSVVITTTNPAGIPPQTAPSETVSGLGHFGGAYIPPVMLKSLTPGQELDFDPVTMAVVTVHSVTASQIVIASVSPAQTLLWGYDTATGLMNFIGREDRDPFMLMRTALQLNP